MEYTLSRKFLLIIGTFILSFAIIGGAIAPVSGLAQPAEDNTQPIELTTQTDADGVISARDSSVEFTSSRQPWTLARMQAARPYPIPNKVLDPSAVVTPPQPAGDPIYIPSVPPKDYSTATQEINPGTLSSEAVLGFTYPAPYTRYENFDDYTVFPYSTTGVLFFSQNGSDFRCSAASIGNNTVWTAGHCVHDGSGSPDGWSENVIFVPAYKNGNMPFGSWSYADVATSTAWFENEDYRFDFGGVWLEENNSGLAVNEVVGNLGFAFNLNPNQHWFSLGYPSVTPFNGKTMQICAASFARNDPSYAFPFPMAIGCDMTGGSSGGPWIIDFSGSPGNTNYINGNNSYRYTGFGEEIYSPYFGEQAKQLLDFLSTGTRIRTNIHIPFVTTND
ncbi:MAG: trypsin-like serine peptidase [Anaerolineales bacterium]